MKPTGNVMLIDIGSRHFRTAVLSMEGSLPFEILHMEETESSGFHCGTIGAMDEAVASIKKCVSEALNKSGLKKVNEIWVGHSGNHFRSDNITEVQSIAPNRRVKERQERQMRLRAESQVPADHVLIHSFLCATSLDGIPRKSAVNLLGTRLVSRFHLIYTQLNVLNNLKLAFKTAGYPVSRFIFNGYAASLSVLDPEEKKLGTLVIHIGSDTTDYIVYQEGRPFLCGAINEGWSQIVKDVAVGVGTPLDRAERLIYSTGSTADFMISEDSRLDVETFSGEPTRVTKRQLAKIMGSTVDEMFCSIRDKLKSTICRGHLPAGVVLTGGGAGINGMIYSAENVFGVISKIGDPALLGQARDFPPAWAAIIGLVKLASDEFKPRYKPETGWERISQPLSKFYRMMFPGAKDPTDPEGSPAE